MHSSFIKKIFVPGILLVFYLSGSAENPIKFYNLKIDVRDLRNNTGVVQFALYNKDGSIPDEHFRNYFLIGKNKITKGKSSFYFEGIPEGKYAICILHDENENGKIDRGLLKPKEGIGFSNYQSIGIKHRPDFSKASFELDCDKEITVKIIYM